MAEEGKKKITFTDRLEVCKDFLRFLKTERIVIDNIPRKDLKVIFNGQYTMYRKQIDPESAANMPKFIPVMMSAVHINLLYTKGNSGPFTQSKPTGRTKQNDPSGATSSPLGEVSSYARSSPSNDVSSWARSSPPETSDSSHEASPSSIPEQANMSQQVEKSETVSKRKRRSRRGGRLAVDQHLTFLKRKSPVAGVSEKADVTKYQFISQEGSKFLCSLCKASTTSQKDTQSHVNGKKHRLNLCVSMIKKQQDELIRGMLGVTITSTSRGENGTYFIDTTENKEALTDLTIANYGSIPVALVHCEMMKRLRVFKLMDQKRVTDGTGQMVQIQPGQSYKIQVRMHARHVGSYHCPVMFHFTVNEPEGGSAFFMVRYLHGRCTDPVVDELKPKTKYKRPPQVARTAEESVEFVPGIKPESESEDKLEKKLALKQYRVPQKLRKMINRGLKDDVTGLSEQEKKELSELRSTLESPVSMHMYKSRFGTLLFLEEVQMEVDIRKYDMHGVTMSTYSANSKLLVLAVPGLAEKRPSVLVGDWLFVRNLDDQGKAGKKEYQGFVHAVLQNEVALGFNQNFRSSFIPGQKFNVRFVFNRLPLNLQHRACELASELSLDKILFPDNPLPNNPQLPLLRFNNRDIEQNEQQRNAVQHIVAGTSGPAPYIVFGPPGTGKTVTIVEAIIQVYQRNKGSCILACTPSNSASDIIASRLLRNIPKASVLRLNAMSRSWSTVPESVRDISNFDRTHRHFYIPDKETLGNYRIIICTLVTAGRLVSANFPSGHFSHVFIDEAGHAVEPEAVIALAGIIEVNAATKKSSGQVILAGDPKQLGPVLRSPVAIRYGLNLSILERLMETCSMYIPQEILYDRDHNPAGPDSHKIYDPRVITKLLQNYRSHPTILKLPNELFYDSELVPCASIDREKLCNWEGLPVKNFPVVFHGVIGEDMREERSPSFFNPEEASCVVKYVEDLMNCRKGGMRLKPEDIGVIAPYRKQVQKIKQVLSKKKYDKISVGSVEEFQGSERTVIIVSTVRSKPEYMSFDMQFKLGFLRNPKRFNVTVTRAKALLIVIGNPHTLSQDIHWKSFIDYCEENKSCKGEGVGADRLTEEEQVEDLAQRLEAMAVVDDDLSLAMEKLCLGDNPELGEQAWRNDM